MASPMLLFLPHNKPNYLTVAGDEETNQLSETINFNDNCGMVFCDTEESNSVVPATIDPNITTHGLNFVSPIYTQLPELTTYVDQPNVGLNKGVDYPQITYSVTDLPAPQNSFGSSTANNQPQPKVEVVSTTSKPTSSRRRMSHDQKLRHNKVEKRYRQSINTKIAKLQSVIPWAAMKALTFECDTSKIPQAQRNKPTMARVNKGEILDIATNYVLHLQQQTDELCREVAFLKLELAKFGRPLPPSPLDP